ncbi:hypothetical protein GCM10022255_069620 [Dactylosporangium darangshiense]|uniref:site-specific DNA-methyltransferase (adenine-specific) n=1 Tax=Dactylosporangium darangshiense TaxID=579108 RepID=A0ABP8DI25_9ACTN
MDPLQLTLFDLTDRPVIPRPRAGRTRTAVPADPLEHARRIAAAVDTAWCHHHGSGIDLHIPAGVVAALALCAEADPDGPDLADQITALDPSDLAQLLRGIWRAFVLERPDLGVRLPPLVEWLHNGLSDWQLDGAHTVARAALRAGQLHLTGEPHRRRATDLFGELLQLLRGPKTAASRGAYYTPQPVAEALARMLHVADATPGQSIADPAAGTGIMLWAAAHILRQHGKDPADYHWYANDIDPLAAACLAVNAHLWALGPNVLIGCADGLDPAWPHYAAVDRATGLDIARTARAFAALNALTSPPEPQ